MLVVCPTHHAIFDLGMAMFLSERLVSINSALRPLTLKHRLSSENLAYHNAGLVRGCDRGEPVGGQDPQGAIIALECGDVKL